MSDKLLSGIVSVGIAVIGVAIVAALVSNQSQTGSVLGALGKSFSGPLACALSPLTGGKNCGTSVSSGISFGGF